MYIDVVIADMVELIVLGHGTAMVCTALKLLVLSVLSPHRKHASVGSWSSSCWHCIQRSVVADGRLLLSRSLKLFLFHCSCHADHSGKIEVDEADDEALLPISGLVGEKLFYEIDRPEQPTGNKCIAHGPPG